MKFLLAVGIAISMFVVLLGAGVAQSGNDLFQQALVKERTEGNMAEAIQLYQAIIAKHGADQKLVARALVQMGRSYEKLGDVGAAVRTYDRLVRDYADQPGPDAEARGRLRVLSGTRPASPGTGGYKDALELVDRSVWQGDRTYTFAQVSFDGRYLSFLDGDGDLAIRDLVSGVNRRLVKADAGKVGASVPSRDGKRVAYAWRPSRESKGELRVVSVDDLQDRLVFSNTAVVDVQPMDWTLDGRRILVLLATQNGASRIAMVDLTGGPILNLTAFAVTKTPKNVRLSSDGLFIAYDVLQGDDTGGRDIFVLSTDGGFLEYSVVRNPANDTVLGWMPDSKRLLFASNRGGTTGVWAVDTRDGNPSGSPPLQVREYPGEIHALGMTLGGSLLYSSGASEVRVLENVPPELARLQIAASQQLPAPMMASIEGVVVNLGSSEPLAEVDVELTRLEGTSSAPLAPGAAAAYAQAFNSGGATDATPPAALAPEVQYAKTTEDGKFAFRNLKPGKYKLVAAHVGGAFNPAEYGQRDPRGRGLAFPIAPGQAKQDARLEMAPTSVITGRVFDDNGEPMGHARVLALKLRYKEGRRILNVAATVHTNERGDYRLFFLSPGQYFVAAGMEDLRMREALLSFPPPGRSDGSEEGGPPVVVSQRLPNGEVVEEAYGLVYYGAVLNPELAKPIDLGPGVTFRGADIPMAVGKARAFHIRGVAINGVTGQPASGVQVRAVENQRSPHVLILTGTADESGAFDLGGAIPGSYSLFAVSEIPSAVPGQAATPIARYLGVEIRNADVDVQLALDRIAPVSGRVVIETRPPTDNDPDLAKIRVALTRDPDVVGMISPLAPVPAGTPPNGVVSASGAFTLRIFGVNGGRFRMAVSGIPTNTYVKAIRMGLTDILADGLQMSGQPENPLEITIGTDAGDVNGAVVDDRQNALPNVVVVLVPEAPVLRRRFDLYKNVTTDVNGRFQIPAVPPGDYKLFAWEYVDTDAWKDAQFLQNYEGFGKPVRVSDGSRQEDIQLAVVPAKR
jgi:Tetratricopeptide repeat/WD40-like Beta Propeller Repeat